MASAAGTTGAAGWRAWLREPRTIGALVVIAALTALASLRGTGKAASATMGTVRLSVVGPKDTSIVAMRSNGFILQEPVVSADGAHLLFSMSTSKGTGLTLRALNRPEFRTVVDSGAIGGFFSPDGSKVGFFIGSEFWTTPVADVKPSRVSRIPEQAWEISTADWHPDGRILVAGSQGLWEVPAAGGAPRLVVANESGQLSRIFAVQVLRDGRLLLSRVSNGRPHLEVRQADGTDASDVLPGLLD